MTEYEVIDAINLFSRIPCRLTVHPKLAAVSWFILVFSLFPIKLIHTHLGSTKILCCSF
jgi:hypothetical protein